MKQSKRKRLEFIESRLFWEGKISRNDLIAFFNISVPQATNDIKDYTDKYPDNISYDTGSKEHKTKETFQPSLKKQDSREYLKQLLVHSVEGEETFYYGKFPSFENFHSLNRPVNTQKFKKITRAINNKKAIFIKYHSIKKDRNMTERWISPHALVYDGYRLHMRAYCYNRKSFRDFNLGRIDHITDIEFDSEVDVQLDHQWETSIDAIIKPHPDFIDHQKECVEAEFQMKEGQLIVPVRAAFFYYFKRKYGFDITNYQNSDVIEAEKQQIVLENQTEMQMKVDFLYEISKTKLKDISYRKPDHSAKEEQK